MVDTTPWQPACLPADAVEVGHVREAWGVRGWLRLHVPNQGGDALLHAKRWFLLPPDAARGPRGAERFAFDGPVEVKVIRVRWHGEGLVAQLAGIGDRDVAESLRGARIFLARADFPPLQDPDEYYWVDLIGLTVVNREGVHLGVVQDLLSTGPHAVLCLQAQEQGVRRERLIPFVKAYVDDVDLVARRITVDWQPDY
jgi:16S rRNA processing protein RimM